MIQDLQIYTKNFFLLPNVIVVFFVLLGCTKDELKPDYTLSIEDGHISMVVGHNEDEILSNAVILKKDAFVPDSFNAGGYAYSSVMKYNNGVFLISAMGHPGFFNDFYPGVISCKKSYDSGRTWTASKLMQENIGQLNVMHPSVLTLPSGNILSLFLIKNSKSDLNIMCKESADSGLTWQPSLNVGIPHEGYKITMNGRLYKMKSGRLILPVSFMRNASANQDVQLIFCYLSDDNGRTWRKTKSYGAPVMTQEPGVTELSDATLLMCIRSNTGKVLFSVSRDSGESWSNIQKSTIDTPEAPEAIIYSEKYKALFMVWNDAVYDPAFFLNRSTLSIAVSRNNGMSWTKIGNLDKDPLSLFFYPALLLDNDELIITYSKYKINIHQPSVVFERLNINKLIN